MRRPGAGRGPSARSEDTRRVPPAGHRSGSVQQSSTERRSGMESRTRRDGEGHGMIARRSALRGVLSGAAMLMAGGGYASRAARAQPATPWPDRPIRLLVPFAPGGVTDSIGRLSAEWLTRRLGQSVVVENRSGANGAIAAEMVARSKPDSYTLLTASASQMVMLPALTHLSFDPASDLVPVSI